MREDEMEEGDGRKRTLWEGSILEDTKGIIKKKKKRGRWGKRENGITLEVEYKIKGRVRKEWMVE